MEATASTRPWRFTLQAGFILALLVYFVLLSAQYSHKINDGGSAFRRWTNQIQALERGKDVYQLYEFPVPPLVGMLLIQFTHLHQPFDALGWFYCKVMFALAAYALVFRMIETSSFPFPLWARVATVLLSLKTVTADLQHGNINLLVLILIVVALFAYQKKYDILAGILLALAIYCRITPALFLFYFTWKRSWKTLAACAVALPFWIWIAPALYFGFEANAHLIQSWANVWIWPYLQGGAITSELQNQSLPGLIERLLTHSPSVISYPNNQPTPALYSNMVDIGQPAAHWLIKTCMGLYALLIIWVSRTSTVGERVGWRLPAEFSVILIGMLLFCERTWKHHCVTLILPIASLIYYLAATRCRGSIRAYVVATLAAAFLLMASTVTGSGATWDEFGKQTQIYGAYTWALIILAAALAVILRRGDGTPTPARV